MTTMDTRPPSLPQHVCHRAVEARDPRFDGVFYVGITTTRIYCRPVCPSRPADPGHRRFFGAPAVAEAEGFRPCFRCRPELAPGRAMVDAVSRLASAAAGRIAAGALNGRPVSSLASDLFVSERHLRRALKRELGVSPVELAQTHRLLLAKRLLSDTTLDMSRVAFASGFQSLRRFNSAFRERYRMSPTDLRRRQRSNGGALETSPASDGDGVVSEPLGLTLSYRRPFAWRRSLAFHRGFALPGVESFEGGRYRRTVRLEGEQGLVSVEDVPSESHLTIEISPTLVRALMPLLARVRRAFDLDAEPAAVDSHLAQGGLADVAEMVPGLRIPGAFDGFEAAIAALLDGGAPLEASSGPVLRRVVRALGEPVETATPGLERLVPEPEDVAEAGVGGLAALGVPERRARTLVELAERLIDGRLWLDPDGDIGETRRALAEVEGLDEGLATLIAMRALRWPDAFPATDERLLRIAGARSPDELRARAEAWRPWRAYAALHLWASHARG